MANNSRRSFLKQTTLLGAAVTAIPEMLKADVLTAEKIGTDAVILFQGDSITDGNRTRDNDWNHVMGHGYACLLASRLWYDHPEKKFHFYNRGISGNKITDLAARWKTDTLALKPDVLSILIGVNDVQACVNGDANYSAENYETGYRALLKQTKDALPNIKLIICEPFILPGARVNGNFDKWTEEVAKRQVIAKKLALEFGAVFVPLQQPFNDALAKAPVDYWIWDGIHPMPAGHELMARQWLMVVGKKIGLV
ncbi:SGNH/GDSL hydrolase family protein [Mucilaginibacter sp. ZT4R22]|uniref:SGNH/GDSL hydrolase family protein n=2 Tax=Mucilaginibacter pankratovii TaxID=2772110 RepID=A0ABR7WRQ1_9SPHI|nr:SGNH/GDSL hydrolase family protein [Mucilaginibacter pankratovii]